MRGQKSNILTKKEVLDNAIEMLRFFTTHEWFFQYDNLEAVLGAVPARHRYLYDGDITWINWEVRAPPPHPLPVRSRDDKHIGAVRPG